MNKKLKSVGAVVAGFLTVAVLSTLTDAVLENMGVFPSYQSQMESGSPVWLLLTALAYRSIYAVLGGFVTAMLAPGNPMKHVMILGIIGTIGGVVGIFVGWQFGNQWYPIALAVTAYPLIWFGGKLAERRSDFMDPGSRPG
jgi:hypothetical protein